ncbi:small conductance calcium-activated potassium channel protein 2-like [Saccoglossus kowalevskii]
MPESLLIVIGLKSAVSFITILTVGALYYYYNQQTKMLIIKHHLPDNSTVLASPLRTFYLVELCICASHVPPLLEFYIPEELQLCIFLRFYLTARYMREHNDMAKSKSTRFLASVLQTELHSSFLIKTYFLKHPFLMILIFYCLNIFGVAYAVFCFDRAAATNREYNNFMDSVWMLVVTMTTLGFGDVRTESLFGRTLVGISSIFGIFLMALLISVIHEALLLTQQEKRILAYVERQEFFRYRKDLAARCIQAKWRLHHHNTSYKPPRNDVTHSDKYHKRLRRVTRSMHPSLVAQLAHNDTAKRLECQLYNALYNWRAVRKAREDHWVREFVTDNTAILLTDVARKIETIEENLSKINEDKSASLHNRVHGDVSSRKVVSKIGHLTDVITSTMKNTSSNVPVVLVKPAPLTSPEFDSRPSNVIMRQIVALDEKLDDMYNTCKSELHALRSVVMTMSNEKSTQSPVCNARHSD